jgi:hypothetical protein
MTHMDAKPVLLIFPMIGMSAPNQDSAVVEYAVVLIGGIALLGLSLHAEDVTVPSSFWSPCELSV